MIRLVARGVRRALAAGLLAAAATASVAAADPETAARAVGEKPAATTAEQVALRDQGVLLPRSRITVELALAYGRAERDFGSTQLQQQAASTELAVRYGLWRDVQLSVRLPWSYRRVAAFNPDATVARSSFGDASVGVFGVVLREDVGRPNVILSVDGVVPTGPGDAALGGGLSVTKSYDPVILFAGVSYLYGLSTNVSNLDRSLAQHDVGFNLGLAFAVNEAVALGAQLAGTNRSYPPSRTGFRSREAYRLQLGVTLLVTRGLFVEPIVATAVGAGSPDLTLGVSVPLTF